jgi:4-amino-4-deoxy-L-arabinose transferase-like glycosyltransferase
MAKKTIWRAGLALIYAIFAFLIVGIRITNMHPDEYLVYFFTRRDLTFLFYVLADTDVHPPLWFSSFWAWWHLVGDSEFAGRVYSILLSMMTLSLVYQLGRKWFGAARFGLFAIILLGVNAYFFTYALEIRPYALIMLLSAWSMWAFQRWLTRRTWRTAILYAVSVAAMLYVHYFLFVLILAQVIYFVLARPSRRLLAQGFGAAGLAFLLWLPWLPAVISQMSRLRETDVSGGNDRGLLGSGVTTVATSIDSVVALLNTVTNGQIGLYALILILGVVLLWPQKHYRLALIWGLGAPALSFAINTVFAIYTPRYVVYLIIGLALALGAALAAVQVRLRWLALAAVAAVSLWTLPTQLPNRIPYRDLYQRVSAVAKPGDVIFFDEDDAETRFLKWQMDHYLGRDLRQNRVETVEEASHQRRVWFATNEAWHYNPDVQKRFAELQQTHPLQTVIGECSSAWCYLIQLLEATPLSTPLIFGGNLSFWGADVDSVTRETIEARLWWKVDQPPELDYSIGLHLLDGSGALVAQVDRPIRDPYLNQDIQTSQLEPQRIYIDARTLELSPGLPIGNYQLVLVIYQSWDSVRLLLPDGSDKLVLEEITITPS